MPLDDAERDRLEEIERGLARDHPDVSRVLRPAPPVRRALAVPVLAAAGVFLVALVVLSVMAGSVLPTLLALPPVAVTLLLLRWPDIVRTDPEPTSGPPDRMRPGS